MLYFNDYIFLQKIKNPLLPIISSYNDLIKIKIKISEKQFFIERLLLKSFELIQNDKNDKNEDTVTLLLKWMIFYLYLFDGQQYCIDITINH